MLRVTGNDITCCPKCKKGKMIIIKICQNRIGIHRNGSLPKGFITKKWAGRKGRRLPKPSLLESQPLTFGDFMRKIPSQLILDLQKTNLAMIEFATASHKLALLKPIQSP